MNDNNIQVEDEKEELGEKDEVHEKDEANENTDMLEEIEEKEEKEERTKVADIAESICNQDDNVIQDAINNDDSDSSDILKSSPNNEPNTESNETH